MNEIPNRFEHRFESRLERRGAQRFEVHQSSSLAVHYEGRTVPGFIQDLSGRGIFFYAETVLPQGAIVELTFNMPSEITLGESMPVRCRGRVLRASYSTAGRFPASQRSGIAVQFDSYHYLPSNVALSPVVRVPAARAATASSGSTTR